MDYIKNVEVIKHLLFDTDHRVLQVTMQLKRKRFFVKATKPNVHTLDRNKFQTELYSQFTRELQRGQECRGSS